MNMLIPIVILLILIGLLMLLFFSFRATMNNLLHALKGHKTDDLPPVRTDTIAVGTVDAAKIIEAQSQQAIVFRQHFPPRFARSLSYFGGAPTADAGFHWPRWQKPEGNSRALTFIMQIDCREIPPSARLGVMPDDGVLYVFMELSDSLLGSAYRVIHCTGPTDGWVEVPLPVDLPPALSRYRCKYAMAEGHLPRVLPRWDFTPTVIAIPAGWYGEREDAAPYLWPGIPAVALRVAQGGPIIIAPQKKRRTI